MSLTTRFAHLFAGRIDAYGTEQGGCDRPPENQQTYTHYLQRIANHLTDTPTGIYPTYPPSQTNWGCVDFDEGYDQSWGDAQNLYNLLQMLGFNVWTEKSRSKGYHIWIFLQQPHPAHLVRQALINACLLVGAPTKEINPKQDHLAEGQIGNYVRLPYPHGTGGPNGAQTMVDTNGDSIPLEQFVEQATTYRHDEERFLLVRLSMVAPEKEPSPAIRNNVTYSFGDTEKLIQKIHDEGPLEGVDRSSTLWKLARLCAEHPDYTLAKTFEVVDSANQRWGKDYADGVLYKLVEKAWNQ